MRKEELLEELRRDIGAGGGGIEGEDVDEGARGVGVAAADGEGDGEEEGGERGGIGGGGGGVGGGGGGGRGGF